MVLADGILDGALGRLLPAALSGELLALPEAAALPLLGGLKLLLLRSPCPC